LGLRVLLLRLDLEAPGLERYLLYNESPLFNDPSGRAAYEDELTGALRNPGLMDLLTEYKTVLTQPPVPPAEDEREPLLGVGSSSCAAPRRTPRRLSAPARGLAHAPLRGGAKEAAFQKYAQSVRDFDWAEFYEKWGGNSYIEFFRKDIAGDDSPGNHAPFADIVLIDSRTGVTEAGRSLHASPRGRGRPSSARRTRRTSMAPSGWPPASPRPTP